MSGICTSSVRKNGPLCDHRSLAVNLDGESFSFDTGEAELDAMPWDTESKRHFVLLGLRRLRFMGLALDDAPGIVINGGEGTNVKPFTLFGPGLAITKTNIGTTYISILPGF